jgi:hypothetical protein
MIWDGTATFERRSRLLGDRYFLYQMTDRHVVVLASLRLAIN